MNILAQAREQDALMSRPGTPKAFLNLQAHERRIVLVSAIALLGTWIGLRLFGFPRWQKVLFRFSNKRQSSTSFSLEESKRLANLATATARRFFLRTNCLEQSLVIWFLLRRRGASPALRFGGRKDGAQFEAHAWVESESVVLNDEGSVRQDFIPFEPLERPPIALEKYIR